MKISVFTVCFNSAQTIRHTLDSFFAQDYSNKELIIVDGGSSDDTLKIINAYPSKQITLISESDRGMYDALNKAMKLYTGDAFGLLNSDDRYASNNVLSTVADALNGADMIHGDIEFVTEHFENPADKQVIRRWKAIDRPPSGFRSGWMPAHPSFYVKRKVADETGEFSLDYNTASDYDWMLRAIELNDFSLRRLDCMMVEMLEGGKSTRNIKAKVTHNLEALKSRRKWLGTGLLDYAFFAKPMRKISQFLPVLTR
ncbi:MAG: glycosyltransferase family 2 protein [Hyphomicrobiales bacterium]